MKNKLFGLVVLGWALCACGSESDLLVFDCDPGTDDSVAMFLMSKAGVAPDVIIATYGNMPGAYTRTNAWLMANYCGFTNTLLVAGAQRPTDPEMPEPTCGDFHGPDGLAGLAEDLTERIGAPRSVGTLDDALARIRAADRVTYIAVAPLTSLSQLLNADPSITNKIVSTLIMGGGIDEFNKEVGFKDLEYNFGADGCAVTNVFASGLDLTLFPLDITHHHANVTYPALTNLLATGRFPEICRLVSTNYASNCKYTAGVSWAVLHDTLPVLYYLDPSVFTMENTELQVASH